MELLFLSPSFSEILLVLFLVLLLFGSKKLPDLARGLGKGIREFKDATGEIQKEIRSGMNEAEKPIQKINQTINSEARKK
jgi:sec-independent protein translocase protein TatA